MILFNQQIANLLESGIPLMACFELLVEQNMISASFGRNVIHALQAGEPLSTALKQHGFPDLSISFIQAAEEHGNYAFGFKQCEQYDRIRTKLVEGLLQASIYPLFVLTIVVAALTFMVMVVLPRFSELYQMMGLELPWMTMGLLYFFDGLRMVLYLFAGILFLALIGFKIIQMCPKDQQAIYTRPLYRLPIIRWITPFWMTHYFSIQLGSLLQAGVPLLQALHLIEGSTPWSQLFVRIQEIKTKVLHGIPFHQAIENPRLRLFLPSLERMAAMGEKTGRLDQMLLNLAQITEQMIKSQADYLSKSLAPLLILFMGGIVAVTVIAMFLPMLQLVRGM